MLLAPMAGITDQVFRSLCLRYGAALASTEMIGSSAVLRDTRKTQLRLVHSQTCTPLSVQIAGYDANIMADAARYCVDQGADIIDINMGCPAKKVCNKAAGSALLRDEKLVAQILETICAAVDVPVTLKTRIGWSQEKRNGVTVARIAEAAGIRALAIHGRTRACQFRPGVDYEAIGEIKRAVGIPVIANGDILTAQDAKSVLEITGADAVMIGRGAQGAPWVFRNIQSYLDNGTIAPALDMAELRAVVSEHIEGLHQLYGERQGVRVARKHIRWYMNALAAAPAHWQAIARVDEAPRQLALLQQWLTSVDSWPGREAPMGRAA